MSSARSLALYRLSRTRSRRSAGLAFGRLTLLLGALWIIVGKDLQGYNMLSSPSPWNPGGGARGLFFLCVLNVMLINAFACLSVARSITEEREAERLGLLRMTGLGPLTILLGKAGARTVDGLELLLVQLPLALLLISPGGVEAREILDLFGLLIAWLLLSTSLATCASVLCRSSRAASGLSALALGALCFLGPLARMAATSASPPSFVPELSPLQLYSDWHFDAGRSSGALPETLLIWLGLALGSLWLSIRLFERRLRAAPPQPPRVAGAGPPLRRASRPWPGASSTSGSAGPTS